MTTLTLSQTRDPFTRIRELTENLKRIDEGGANIDIGNIEYITPLTVLPLAALLASKVYHNEIQIFASELRRKDDLVAVGFPFGVRPEEAESSASTIPICKLDLTADGTNIAATLERCAQKYSDLLLAHLSSHQENVENYHSPLSYFLSELFDNVHQHAEASNFWIFSKFWVDRGELEICMLDDGMGIKRRYDRCGIGTRNHVDALGQAVQGLSSKGLDRGYGIGSNIKMFTSADLQGEICLISGNACYFKSAKTDVVMGRLPIFWKGLIFSGRLIRPNKKVNISRYAQG